MKARAVTIILGLALSVSLNAGVLYDKAFPLLQRLNSIIVSYQCSDKSNEEYGAIYCPGECLYHTRAAEAIWPLAYEYSVTGDDKRLEQALILADWLFSVQQEGGEWKETPEEWTGTTTDQLLMLLLTYPVVEPSLDKERKAAWLSSMEKSADYLQEKMSNRFASINYCATTTATLSEAYLLFGKDSYLSKAKELADMIIAKMNLEYFIEGEGGREGDYKYGVDLGYNLEMSLWGIAKYAINTGDSQVLETVLKSAHNHLAFVYPDGMMDYSTGIRSNKWTIYGSGTSDGPLPLFALLSEYDEAFASAAVRNIEQINKNICSCGLLGLGPSYDQIWSFSPCIYPTFTKAKSLAMSLSWLKDDPAKIVQLPCDKDYDRYFQSLNTAVVRRGPYMATVTAYNYKAKEGDLSKYMHRPSGGTMSALWIEGYGLLEASSQSEYHRWEPMSFPDIPQPKPLTPRIELKLDNATATNLYDFDATLQYNPSDEVLCTVMGNLKDRNQRYSGVAYKIEYEFSKESLIKRYTVKRQTAQGKILIIEPILLYPDLTILHSESNLLVLKREDVQINILCKGANMKLNWNEGAEYKHIYPSLQAIPLEIEITDGTVELCYTSSNISSK